MSKLDHDLLMFFTLAMFILTRVHFLARIDRINVVFGALNDLILIVAERICHWIDCLLFGEQIGLLFLLLLVFDALRLLD